ncbi:aminotransferase class III-fold pyridoxal phosphate-dependent enzyme [Fulvivirga sp. 29W222]|uniref:Aminotransferase class III-fold pyridoxal phosphate-dependent enzyme n=1 Tax=Fulvivirga marina TaxID=2494733 RepID=A0A937FVP3_9BACT|nr:aminotransferase class III-fold pyridoxal phosphate-dependent enzyme [Fulvivirga marina]MBL6446995.1 aminotransferase class III-fold pyridoxal phosphate-dependent enzyme [Fulvivirga marina]
MLAKRTQEERIQKVRQLISEYYGISGKLKALQGEADENYLMESDGGEKYSVKISSANISEKEVEFQTVLLDYLDGKTGLILPKVVKSLNKNAYEKVDLKGEPKILRLLTWVPGRLYADMNPQNSGLLISLGKACGELSKTLTGFDHPEAHRKQLWDPAQADWIKGHFDKFSEPEQVVIALHFYELYDAIRPLMKQLRKGVNYNDANDHNVIVNGDSKNPLINGFIDFGDVVHTYKINELAIVLAYAMMGKNNPLEAACHVILGYNEIFPLEENEVEALFALTCIRLIITVTSSVINKKEHPDNEYLLISEKPAWDLLEKLVKIAPAFAHYRFRAACGWSACPKADKIRKVAKNQSLRFADVVEGLSSPKLYWMDLSVGSLELGNAANYQTTKAFCRQVDRLMEDRDAAISIGRYDEVRPIYTTDAYLQHGNDGPGWRTVHLGVDVFAVAGTPVYAAYDGIVHSFANNSSARDYGPTIILEHEVKGVKFYTLYGHLSVKSLTGLTVGKPFKKGELLAWFGDEKENGEWPPHLHFQMMSDMLNYEGDYPGVVYHDELDVWKQLILDPMSYMGLTSPEGDKHDAEKIIEQRKKRLGRSLSISYQRPLHIVRGFKQYLYDSTARRYLDMVNNVAHVGHEHPAVVRAGQEQMAVLNTNTRYLHEELVHFAEELTATLPKELSVCHFVNSGSEANELALRMVKANTGSRDMIVLETGYHGNTNGCIDISSYKFDGKGGKGAPECTHVVPTPDLFRGLYRSDDATAIKKYIGHVEQALLSITERGRGLAGFIAESIMSCAGQIPLPQDYLKEVYKIVRSIGGLCIADEVQVGMGRVGEKFWGFELHDVVPDIVTIGKPLGNGHPLAAVVTTEAVAERFASGMEYFNTFGGNPVSCAIGRAVLSVVREEGLQQNALQVGENLIRELKQLQTQYPIIGDVRGNGLFSGFELVRQGLMPATEEAVYLSNRMRDKGVLMSTDGPDNNVLKLKPPICFSATDMEFFLEKLEEVLKEDFLKL